MLSHFLNSYGNVLSYGTGIFLIALCFVYLFRSRFSKRSLPSNQKRTVNQHFSRDEIIKDIIALFDNSKSKAKEFADRKLEEWVQSLEPNIEDFLKSHFDYFYQKKFILFDIASRLDFISKTKLEEAVVREIEKYILSPTQMERKMENLIAQTVDVYALEMAKGLFEIQCKYELSDADWEEFNREISQLTFEKGGRVYQFNNPTYWIGKGGNDLIITGTVYGVQGFLSSEAFALVSEKASMLLAKLGLKSLIKVGLGKAIAVFAAKIAVGWVSTILIICSDIWSHNSYVSKNKPILKQALVEQIRDIKSALLEGNDYSIMSVITQIEYESVKIYQSSFSVNTETTFVNDSIYEELNAA